MELLEGSNLEDQLVNIEKKGRRIMPTALVNLLDPIVSTLEAAHQQGIVHRDLKPQNIFLIAPSRGGGVRLLDFGLVKLMNAKPLTRQGVVAGSPSYIAPEAWKGGTVDHRIDVYALGIVVFRALAGKVPFDAPDLREKLKLITSAERPSLFIKRPDLPPPIDAWIEQVLAIEPDLRFQRVRAAWKALRNILQV
jgi:serine/threonine-protein kinase